MPIGPPLYVPEPKSGCNGEEGLIVLTQVDELGCTGNWSTRVFQMLSAGKTVQLPTVGARAAARPASPIKAAKRTKFCTPPSESPRIKRRGVPGNRVIARGALLIAV